MDSLNQFKISLRPNNQVSITRQRLAAKRTDRYEKTPLIPMSQDETNNLVMRYASREGLKTSRKLYDPKVRICKPSSPNKSTSFASELLDLTNRFQEQKKAIAKTSEKRIKRGYGASPLPRNFSAKSGQKIRESGAVIDLLTRGNPSMCRVVTLTLPSSGHEAFQAISDWSGYATNRLFQTIRDKSNGCNYWFYVWEHQKRGALHLHICLYHQNKRMGESLGDELVSLWRDILCSISKFSGVDLLHSKGFRRRVESHEMQNLNQEMYKGCGAYFSKYASKCAGRDIEGFDNGVNERNRLRYPVSAYWGSSQAVKRLVRENSLSFKFEGLDGTESETARGEAYELLSQFDIVSAKSFRFKKEIEYKGNGTLTIIEGETEVFYLAPDDYQKLLGLMASLYCDRPSSLISERARKRESYSGYTFGIPF